MSHTSSIIARDTSLPGLNLVLDRELVFGVLAANGAITAGQSMDLDYIRYKPGRRALALYHLNESQGSTRPFVVRAYDAAGWEKFIRAGHADELVQQNGLALPSSQSSIEWFPFDRSLRQLTKLIDPSRRNRVMKRLLEPSTSFLEPDEAGQWNLQTLAFKPARRFVAKASRGSQSIAIKCYTKDDFASAQIRSEAVKHERMAHLVSRTVASNAHYSMIASEWLQGETLAIQLGYQPNNAALLTKAGELLYQWQVMANQCMPHVMTPHNGFGLQSLRTIADDLAWLLPDMRDPLSSLLNELTEPLQNLAAAQDIIHGDFYAKQILVNGEELRLIDFDEIGRGHRYQDLGNFIGHMYWDAVRSGKNSSIELGQVEAHAGCLLDGYAKLAGKLDRKLIQASIAIGILRCLSHTFRRGLPDWADKLRQLFDCALLQITPSRVRHHHFQSMGASSAIPTSAIPTVGKPLAEETSVSNDKVQSAHDVAASLPAECLPYLDVPTVDACWQHSRQLFSPPWNNTYVSNSRLMRHKPGKRLLVEYSLGSKDRLTELRVIGKCRLAKPVNMQLLELHENLQSLRPLGVIVPRVVGRLPTLNLWFQEKIAGQHVLNDSSHAGHRSVGAALAELHLSGVKADKTHTIDAELRVLREQYDQWLLSSDRWRKQSMHVFELAEKAAARLRPVSTMLVHRDFYFDQVLATDDGVALLDFDLACMGQAELDVGNYLAHLEEYSLRCGQVESWSEAGQAFVDGYRSRRSDLCLPNVDLWHNLSLARLAAISQRIPSRHHTTEHMLELCLDRFQK